MNITYEGCAKGSIFMNLLFHRLTAAVLVGGIVYTHPAWAGGLAFHDSLGGILLAAPGASAGEPGLEPHAGNPILPGYYADPSLVQHDGTFYLYATLDPWGDRTLGCWESSDFKNWTYRVLNWPTKDACISPTSGGAAVWAPSVVQAKNGKFSPGHHTVFHHEGKDYILYHRHGIPFDPKSIGRQVCVDELTFTTDGLIEKVVPTHEGAALVRGRKTGLAATATTSNGNARYAVDDNYATRWVAKGGWLQLDLGAVKAFRRQEIRFEYAWKPYRFTIEASDDGLKWKTLAEQTCTGSPVVIEQQASARYLRLTFADGNASLWEWIVCE
jgi:hypothetical protein